MNNSITGVGKVVSVLSIMVLVVPVFAYAAPKPECVSFKASDTTVDAGDRVRLSWKTKNATKVEVDPIEYRTTNEISVENGHVTVFPKKDTEYTLTVFRGTTEDECTVSVDVKSDVSGTTKDDADQDADKETIVVTETREQTPTSAISIAALPYTGVDMTPLLSTLFFVLLALWVGAVSYTYMDSKRTTSSLSRSVHGLGAAIPHAEYQTKTKEWFIR